MHVLYLVSRVGLWLGAVSGQGAREALACLGSDERGSTRLVADLACPQLHRLHRVLSSIERSHKQFQRRCRPCGVRHEGARGRGREGKGEGEP